MAADHYPPKEIRRAAIAPMVSVGAADVAGDLVLGATLGAEWGYGVDPLVVAQISRMLHGGSRRELPPPKGGGFLHRRPDSRRHRAAVEVLSPQAWIPAVPAVLLMHGLASLQQLPDHGVHRARV